MEKIGGLLELRVPERYLYITETITKWLIIPQKDHNNTAT